MPQTDTRREAATHWLMGRINYERVAVAPYSERQLKLDRMRQLLVRIGSPDAGMRLVHVAGTKGKGSTAKMTAAMLTAAGYRTGVYSSPHLETIEERFAVDGRPCSADDLVGLVDRLRPVAEAMDSEGGDATRGPTFFDLATAMAFLHFADQQVDAAVIEVGLGGRLDSTNVCLPLVSVITSISLDHTKQLGSTLASIATEKAGIVKPGVPLVCGVTQDEPYQTIAGIARQHGCRHLQLGDQFGYRRAADQHGQHVDYWNNAAGEPRSLNDVWLPLMGEHQAHNAAVALAVMDELADQGWSIPEQARREGLGRLRLPGRVERFPGSPTVIIDTAHNDASARALAESLREQHDYRRRVLVLATSRDKDSRAIVGALAPCFDHVIVTRYLENPRATAPEELADLVRPHRPVTIAPTPIEAFQLAVADSPGDAMVCIAGSFFIAAELRPHVMRRCGQAAP